MVENGGMKKQFEFYFTPRSASWLNMFEIEFSAQSARSKRNPRCSAR